MRVVFKYLVLALLLVFVGILIGRFSVNDKHDNSITYLTDCTHKYLKEKLWSSKLNSNNRREIEHFSYSLLKAIYFGEYRDKNKKVYDSINEIIMEMISTEFSNYFLHIKCKKGDNPYIPPPDKEILLSHLKIVVGVLNASEQESLDYRISLGQFAFILVETKAINADVFDGCMKYCEQEPFYSELRRQIDEHERRRNQPSIRGELRGQ